MIYLNKVISLDALQRLVIEPLKRLIDKRTEIATDDDIIAMMQEIDAFPVVIDENGSIMTDEDGSILLI